MRDNDMPDNRDPEHPIIDRPWDYNISSLCYHNDANNPHASYVDLTLRHGATVRRLRFVAPQDFAIDKGQFPQRTGGMRILDIRERQWEGMNVQVADFEATPGALTFYARDVIDLDDEGSKRGWV